MGGLSFLDEIADLVSAGARYGDEEAGLGAKMARHLDDVDPAELVKAGRGLGYVDELAEAAGGLRYSDEAIDAATANRLSNLDEFTGGNRATKQGDELRAALTGSSDSGALSRRLDEINCANSFTAGTPVETDEGQKAIEEIEAGDKVLAEDPETGEQGYYEVVALTNHPTDEVLRVTLDAGDDNGHNETAQLNNDDDSPAESRAGAKSNIENQTSAMEITPDHPVYVEGKGWLWAENLSVGDRLRRSDGGMAKVLAIERVALDTPEVVYNFTVKGPHTYFVLEAGVLVHNAGVKCVPVSIGNPWRDPKTGQFAKSPLPEEYRKAMYKFGIDKNRLAQYYEDLEKQGVTYEELINNFLKNNPNVTPAEAHAVFGYTSNLFYGKLNRSLRDQVDLHTTQTLEDLINRGLEKFPVISGTPQHRGINLSGEALQDFLKQHQKSETVLYNDFVSAAIYPDPNNWEEANVRLIITPTDTRDISDLAFGVHFYDKVKEGAVNNVQESLFKTGSRFFVNKVQPEIEDGRTIYYITLTQIR
ncbi:MAG: hypothetical protein FOGNACKC_06180 [Anaerolineae bacterium]|nr:hypothetical protein [Anaerolineae bacterium]